MHVLLFRSRNSSVGITTGYELGGRASIPGRARNVSLLYSIQTGSKAYPASSPMGAGNTFPGVKRLGREADHSPPSSSEVKNGGAIPALPHTSSWRGD
jgi:hypothetical protein